MKYCRVLIPLASLFALGCDDWRHADVLPGDPAPPASTAEALTRTAPPPISGGTLLISADGHRAFVADQDQDVVWIVDLTALRVLAVARFERGAEPGRLAEDGAGRVHVALRRAGALATLNATTGEVLLRRPVCAAPRGVAVTRTLSGEQVHVACATGELVSLPSGAGDPLRTVAVGGDLRDVVPWPDPTTGALLVTRFRSTELFLVSLDGSVTFIGKAGAEHGRTAEVAWRAVGYGGGVLVLHQTGTLGTIDTHGALAITGAVDAGAPVASYGSGAPDQVGTCGGAIVGTAVSNVDGTFPRSVFELPAVGAVDLAVMPGLQLMAIAAAGQVRSGAGDVLMLDRFPTGSVECQRAIPVTVGAQAVAVAMTVHHSILYQDTPLRLVVQTRDPSQLVILSLADDGSLATRELARFVFSDDGEHDAGHALFHGDSGSGIACMSCHPEGGDDGRVWSFDFGPRRTPPLRGGILETAPFHWSGDEPRMVDLVDDVFVHRMGGPPQDAYHVAALAGWIERIPRVAPPPVAEADAVERGRALFASPSVGCTSCHNGPKLTNNQTLDVGTGGAFQVPSLLGLAARAPYLHDGCATTLLSRFVNPCGGGDRHGHTSQLSGPELDDLVAYLTSL